MSDEKPQATTSGEGGEPAPGAAPARRARPCPNCSKLSVEKYYPFCSRRCADVDLHRWFKEGYSIPVVEFDDIDPSELEE